MTAPLIMFLPGALAGTGAAILLIRVAPIGIRPREIIDRYATLDHDPHGSGERGSGKLSERIGAILEGRLGELPGFTPPRKALALIDYTPAAFYFRKLLLATLGLLTPALLAITLTALTGQVAVLPALLAPVLGMVFWFVTDYQVRVEAAQRRREFTRFVTVYLELVAVALLGNSTPDAALTAAAQVSDSWVFTRIRREYRLADTLRLSKWQALDSLASQVDVPALGEMARIMKLSDAQIGLRDQLRAACDKLRSQVVTDEATAAEAVSNQMQAPILLTILPVLALVLIPTLLQLPTLN